jgi:hypothetical protein
MYHKKQMRKGLDFNEVPKLKVWKEVVGMHLFRYDE